MKLVLAFLFLFVVAVPADAWWEDDYYHHHHRYRSYRHRYYDYPYRHHRYYGDYYRCCNEDRYEIGRERPRQTFRLKKPDGTEIETYR